MPINFVDRVRKAWDVFKSNDYPEWEMGESSYYRPDRTRLSGKNERTITASIYNRIAVDCASIRIRHVRLDENDRYKEEIQSGLNDCLKRSANIDQTGRAFIQDAVMSLLDEGHVVLIPVDTSKDPNITSSYDIYSMRTGKVVEWYPRAVKVDVYNDKTGKHQQVKVSKDTVAIIENPFYAVMNERNSTLQRLIRKLSLLDSVDEQTGSGKLDMIIQLPYIIKTEARRKQAEERRLDIERQLSGSKYGIAYTDGTEKVIQLNRSLENNLMSQIEYLTRTLYGQLNMDETILNGTANEETMVNYQTRTIEPIVSALVDGMIKSFITQTARSQGQSIMAFTDPFRLVPTSKLPDMADKLTRNEIVSSNEMRQAIGFKPSNDPDADSLRNKNLNPPNEASKPTEQSVKENNDEN